MTKLPLSPRIKLSRAVLVLGWLILSAILTWLIWSGPTQEQMVNAPSGEYQR